MADDPQGTAPSRQPFPSAYRAEPSLDRTARMPAFELPDESDWPAPPDEAGAGPDTAMEGAVTGHRVSGAHIREEQQVPRSAGREARPGFRARYAVVYDVDGPRVRLGIGWALLVGVALAYRPARPAALAGLYAAAAAWAAFQTVTAWRPERVGPDRWLTAAGAAAVPLASAAFGVRGTGGALIGLVAVALVAGWVTVSSGQEAVAFAGRIVTCAVWVGLAAAGVVLTLRYEIGAVITLLVLVAVYEASDYIVGSGASNRIEGPLAGIISIAVVTAVVAFLKVPPFEGLDAFLFGALAAVLCPVGQLVGSALLPSPTAHAPALRRLDSLLVLAPVWAWSIGWLLTHQT